jgi:hypothetical protein
MPHLAYDKDHQYAFDGADFQVKQGMHRQEALDPQTEEALVASKVDYLAEEYSQLLVSQLDQQRAYFEALLQKRSDEVEAIKQQADAFRVKSELALQQATETALTADKARRAAENKLVCDQHFLFASGLALALFMQTCCHTTSTDYTMQFALPQHAAVEKVKELEKECEFFREVNMQLEMNQADLGKARKHAEETAAAELASKSTVINDLQEQVLFTLLISFANLLLLLPA